LRSGGASGTLTRRSSASTSDQSRSYRSRSASGSLARADAGQVGIALPELQPLPDLGVGLRIAIVEPLATPGEVLAEVVEGLPAPEGTFRVVGSRPT
jgi:hypothetical protein